MSKNIISISRGMSTMDILRRELDRIEQLTGSRPVDWLWSAYDEDLDDYYTADGYDFDAFEMHISALADSFLDFHHDHVRDLHLDFFS